MTLRDPGAERLGSSTALAATGGRPHPRAPWGATLALTVTLAVAGFLVLMAALLLVVHPPGNGQLATTIVIQNQNAKTLLFVVTFVVLLPAAVLIGPRVADAVTAKAGRRALSGLAGLLVATLAAMLILVKLSASLPWGDGLAAVLAGALLWSLMAATALAYGVRAADGRALQWLAGPADLIAAIAAALVLGVLVCVTSLSSVSSLALVLGAAVALAVLAGHRRLRLSRLGSRPGWGLDLLVLLILLLAAPDVVIFHASAGLPNAYFPPGVIQFQQDWILGPTNQLLGGGALLVNVPASQYGVGLVYFLAAWFHLAPIGYGTFGLLDGLLTAVVYGAAFSILRIAGVGRLLAGAAVAFAVVVLLYNLPYSVGALPEEGPLRFGLPMAVILAVVAAQRWSRRAPIAHALAFVALGVGSIWALEAFAYTALTLGAMLAVEAWLIRRPSRVRWLIKQVGFAVAACVGAHLLLAAATLVATGHLPNWGQYLVYVQALLLGGREGSVTYGFSNWSPGLVVGAVILASAAGVMLLARRAPVSARRRPATVIALTGSTAYALACLSYIDNRSSTYLLLYTSLPVLMAGVLWLHLLLAGDGASSRARLGGLAFVLSVGVLMLAAAWPAAGDRLSRSALAHARPGGGLVSALHRLWHPPPIDPRAPEGERLVNRYLQGPRALILLPPAPDLAIEIAMRLQRASPLFIGDPSQDMFVPSVWRPRIRAEIARLRPGGRALVDATALHDVRLLRHHGADYVLHHPLTGRSEQLDWILHGLDRRFRLTPIHATRRGFVVVRFDRRR
jgi:hypothetical protein